MRVRALTAGLLLGASTAVLSDGAEGRPRIDELVTRMEDGRLHVEFRVADGLSAELIERIASGIEVTFEHEVEVLARRRLWADRVVARVRIETTAAYDSLTRQYELHRRVEATSDGSKPAAGIEEERRSSSSEEEMRAWMTAPGGIPPIELATLPERTPARIRVESTLGRRWVLLFPARQSVSAERRLER